MSTCPNCLIDYGRGEDGVNRYYIRFCPLHAAAAEMRCALSDAEAWIGEGLGQFAAKDAKGALLRHMREALAAASGQEQGE